MAITDIIRAKLPSSAISSKIQWFIFQYKMKAMAGSSPIRGVLVDWWAFEWFVWVPVEQRRKVGEKMQLAAFLLVRHDHHMWGEFLRRQQYSVQKLQTRQTKQFDATSIIIQHTQSYHTDCTVQSVRDHIGIHAYQSVVGCLESIYLRTSDILVLVDSDHYEDKRSK